MSQSDAVFCDLLRYAPSHLTVTTLHKMSLPPFHTTFPFRAFSKTAIKRGHIACTIALEDNVVVSCYLQGPPNDLLPLSFTAISVHFSSVHFFHLKKKKKKRYIVYTPRSEPELLASEQSVSHLSYSVSETGNNRRMKATFTNKVD